MATFNNQGAQYVLVGDSKPIQKNIPSRHKRSSPLLYLDKDKGVQREMRYAPNQKSVFVDEQNEFAIVEPIVFDDGVLLVDPSQLILKAFMDKHPMNIKNGGTVFKEFKLSEEEDEKLDREQRVLKVQIMVDKAGEDMHRHIAEKISKRDTSRMSAKGIKLVALGAAKLNPEETEKILKTEKGPVVEENTPDQKKMDIASFAIANNHVSLRKDNTELFYNIDGNKSKISPIPSESTPAETLAEFFLKEEGMKFYAFLVKEKDKE